VARKPPPATPLSAACRIVVLAGKEAFLIGEYTSQMQDLLAKAYGEVDTVRFDGATAALADVLDECRTFGLMQQHKLVVVDNAEQLVKEDSRPLFERYAASPSENATLVLRAERWYAGKLDELIAKVGSFQKCEAVGPALAATWAVKRAEKRHGARLAPGAASLLVERIGSDLARLDTELAKLAVSVSGPGGAPAEITVSAVEELVGQTREDEAWAIQSTLLSGEPEASVAHVRLILDNARRDAHVPLTWAMVDLARKLHAAARGVRDGMNPFALGGKLKLWPEERREAVLAVARRSDPARLARLLKNAVEADAAGKSGLGDPGRTLERLALEFADAVGSRHTTARA
jgi:DNA polymerase III subunit delta